MRFSKEITVVVLAALAGLAQGAAPAAAQVIPGAADVSRLQNNFQNGDRLPQKPQDAAPLAAQKSVLPEEEAVPENAETLTFTLTGVALDGATVYRHGELDSLWHKDLGKTVSLKEIYEIAAALTAKYRADGYFLSSAYVPAQKIKDGVAHITVVEGYIQDVQLTGNMPESYLLTRLRKKLLELGPLNIKMLERQMLLLNDLPGTHFRAVLKAIPVPGAAPVPAADAAGNSSDAAGSVPDASGNAADLVIPSKRDDADSVLGTKVTAAEAQASGADVIVLGHRQASPAAEATPAANPAPTAAAAPVPAATIPAASEPSQNSADTTAARGAGTMSVDVAARVSAGAPVVFFSPKDDPQAALASKIGAAGGNAQNTEIVELGHRSPDSAAPPAGEPPPQADLGQDVGQLETTLARLGNVELVVVDPIGAYSGTAHPSDEDIRRVLAPIAQAATRHNVSALVSAQSLSAEDWLKTAAPASPPPAADWVAAATPAPAKEGGVLLEIAATAAAPVHGSVSLDNSGSRFIGPWMAGAQLSIDRGLPDFQQAVISLNSTAPVHELKSALGKYIIPLSADGLKVTLNTGYTEGRPGFTLAPDELIADSFTAGAEIDWDAVRQRAENFRILAGLDYLNSRTELLDTPFSHDRILAAKLGAHYDEQDRFNGSTILDATIKKGLEILGASRPGEDDLSRADGRPDFVSLSSTVYRFQNISTNWNTLVGVTAQIADAPLLSSQQFGYGGQSFGRAYDTSEFVGDQGVAAMAELRYDGLKLKDDFHLQPFGFYDIGRVWNRGVGLPATDSGASAGLGLRLSAPKGITTSLTVAEPLTSRASNPPPYSNGKSPRVIVTVGDAY